MDIPNDLDLLHALSTDQSERALEQILHKHGPMVMGVCRRALGDHHEAEDAFQAAFVVLIRRRHSLKLTKSLGAWLHSVALRTATKAKAMVAKQKSLSQLPQDALPSHGLDPAAQAVWAEIASILDHEIQCLPEHMRAPVVLCELEGRSHKDAANELAIPQGTLSVRLSRAKEKLRDRLIRRGIGITTVGLTAVISTHAHAAALSSGEFSAALRFAKLVLAGKSSVLIAGSAGAVTLADAVLRGMRATKIVLAAAAAVAFVCVVVAFVLRSTSPIAASAGGGVSSADPFMAAERAVMHLGDEAFRHRMGPSRIVYFSDGKRLATVAWDSADPKAYLWDAASGRLLREFDASDADGDWTTALAVSPSGETLAVGRNNGTVSVWDVETGRLTFHEQTFNRRVTAIAYMPDGKRLLTAAMDGLIQVSSTDDFRPKVLCRLVPATAADAEENRDWLASVIAPSPDGERVAVGNGATGAIHLFDAESGDLLRTIEAHNRGHRWNGATPAINSLAFTANGRRIISGGFRLVPRNTTSIPEGPANIQLVEARLWDVATGALVRNLIDVDVVGEGNLAVSSNGENFVTADYDSTVNFWRVGDGSPRHEMHMPGFFGGVAFSPDGTTVAITTGKGISFWDGQTAEELFLERRRTYSGISDVAWSKDKLAISYGDGIDLCDAATGAVVRHFVMHETSADRDLPRGASILSFSVDGRLLVGAGVGRLTSETLPSTGIIKAWDAITGALRTTIRVDRRIGKMALADDASVVAVSTHRSNPYDEQLCVYELTSGKLLSRYPADVEQAPDYLIKGLSRVVATRILPGSTQVYVVGEDGRCYYWDYASRRQSYGFFASERTDARACEVRTAIFTPDCKSLVTSGEGKLCVWNVATEKLEHIEQIPTASAWLDLGISSDGRRLAGSAIEVANGRTDRALRIWDLPSGKLALTLHPTNSRATSFAFSPDSKQLLTGLDRGTAMIWDVSTRDPELKP